MCHSASNPLTHSQTRVDRIITRLLIPVLHNRPHRENPPDNTSTPKNTPTRTRVKLKYASSTTRPALPKRLSPHPKKLNTHPNPLTLTPRSYVQAKSRPHPHPHTRSRHSPILAAMAFSSVFVVLNSLRLRSAR
ncbi:hypothetical protein HD592_002331 [Schaalia hyovaginalis]|uniref:Uncharacterized protein n=1 Tax=Schaalia hyovaginalis TaxID=29316 RepID=A0A923IZW6_9ACTO|nr:hypothetical protein [Schaalia hyovaginalis]MBB6335766.1 hypothetical protein [Schaalia hyovaginalis]